MSDFSQQSPFAPPRAVVRDAPEATDELVLAGRWQRLLAYLIDYSLPIVIGVFAGIYAASAGIGGLKGRAATDALLHNPVFIPAMGVVFVACVAWGIWNIVLIYGRGQTVGKMALGLRMVRTDGSRMSFARYFFLRGLIIGLLSAIPFVGWGFRLVDKLLIFRASRKCLHDDIADTLVVTAASSPRATLEGSRLPPPQRF
jgi:uncharacterized RDD family membrane protein YckC